MKFDFLTIGGLTEDIVFFSQEGLLIDNSGDLLRQKLLAFEHGAKINIEEVKMSFGGGAANSAVSLAKLNFRVACLGALGSDDRATRILDNLKQVKVDYQKVSLHKTCQSGFSFILNDRKDRIIFAYRGANELLRVEAQHKNIIKNSAWVYLTSLPNNYLSSLKNIFAYKNKIAWNPGLKQLAGDIKKIKPFLEKTDILLLNKDEGLELIKKSKLSQGLSDDFLNNSKNLILLLKQLGPEKIVLTDGLKGAYFYDGENFYHQKIVKSKKNVDTTGVGDAFNSTVVGFLSKLAGDYTQAMFYGAKNAASLVSKVGAQNGLLTLKELKNN